MWGVVPSSNGVLGESVKDVPLLKTHPIFEGMLVCHSLTLIGEELCGDPLDLKVNPKSNYLEIQNNGQIFNIRSPL